MAYGKGRSDGFGGKNLHSIYITETYWATSMGASVLYSTLIGGEVLTQRKITEFIKSFRTFFFNTYIEIGEDNEELADKIENKFNKLSLYKRKGSRGEVIVDKEQLMSLLKLWDKYNIQVQGNPLMEIIKHTDVMGDKEW